MGRRVGLTGGIASGKSSVAAMLQRRGALIIDADQLAREVVEPGTPGFDAVVARFGQTMVDEQGRLDRAGLGRLVFADPRARRDLEAIIHPRVRQRAGELEAAAGPGQLVVQMIPLLVETGQAQTFDEVIVVDANPLVQVQRLQQRNGLTEPEAWARVNAQARRQDRLEVASHVIHNDGSLEALEAQVDALWSDLSREEEQ